MPARLSRLMGGEISGRRERLGLSQALLAHALDVHPNTLAQWERDERHVAHPAMLRLALDRLADGVRRGNCQNCGADASSMLPQRCLCGALICDECWDRDGRCGEHVGKSLAELLAPTE